MDDMNELQRELYDKVKNATEGLDLNEERIDDVEAQAIAEALKVNTLTWLKLDLGAQAIAEALKVNTTLTYLNLDGNQIGDAGAKVLAEALKGHTTLTGLGLNKSQIGEVGAQAIGEALKVNSTLTMLDLDANQIGDAGAQAIAEALKVNTTLTWLNLDGNQIGDAGAQAIAQALKVNSTLKKLFLDANQIGDAGAQAIGEALKVNKRLIDLRLSENHIGDAGANTIAAALKVNTTLTWLNLGENQIGNVGAEAIAEALKVNTTLTVLGLHTNEIGDDGACALADALEVNTTMTKLLLDRNCMTYGCSALLDAREDNCRLELTFDDQINPLAFFKLPRLVTAEDLQTVFLLLTSGLQLEDQSASLPALPAEIAAHIMDEAHYWQGVQHTKRSRFYDDSPVLKVTLPKRISGGSVRVKSIHVARGMGYQGCRPEDDYFDLIFRDEQGVIRYECAISPTEFYEGNLECATIRPETTPILREMRGGWQVQVRPSENGTVLFETIYFE
ncbi:hypothetical protein CAOG_01221 [Capsaspora owczarzaki ATCC 30864]|uniref:hypothetical protein n=1 Tax=Capsaspora owczarzaki (strain ATCC 30864) TaxID=595528 RepID=UPI0003521635|nr:hypothetical protein CAOG_01221 [Capsaspora owczarzaki ATCC 30864]|eukprot:XP_004349727.2 hypothetical protein CAOG_01221 [Capsaspora owczarzaki ATCC 30864]